MKSLRPSSKACAKKNQSEYINLLSSYQNVKNVVAGGVIAQFVEQWSCNPVTRFKTKAMR